MLVQGAELVLAKTTRDGFPHIANKQTHSQTGNDRDYIHGGADAKQLHAMISNMSILATAAVHTKRQDFSDAAMEQLRVFFTSHKTGMRPRLTFPDNQPVDMVDLYEMPRLLDAIALMQDKIPAHEVWAVRKWFTRFLHHVDAIDSHYKPAKTGLAGVAYDVLRMSIATFLGSTATVQRQAQAVRGRLEQAIVADGATKLPVGLQMDALTVAAELAGRVGVDLWGHKTENGGGHALITAVQALITDANAKGHAPSLYDRTIKLAQRYAARTETGNI